MSSNDQVRSAIDDLRQKLQKIIPGQEFFFLLLPMDGDQVRKLGQDAHTQVTKRMAQHLEKEINQAMTDQRRET